MEDLKKAYWKEKNPDVKVRILAVHMVRVRQKKIDETAMNMMQSERWVRDWLKRYDLGGLTNLQDLPRSGRPRSVQQETIRWIINQMVPSGCTPATLQERVRQETGTKLHITYIRKIMRGHGLSPKIPQRIHINRTGKKSVQNWQYRLRQRIPRLRMDGFTVNGG